MARVYLTGGLRLDGPAGSFDDADLPGHQGRIAFAALVIERRALSYDELADIIWDESPPEQWKSAVSPVISKIRTLVSRTGLDGAVVLASSGGAYAFHAPADMWIDAEDALRRLDRAEGALRHGQPADAAPDATIASSILRRPFLTGVDNLWADRIRRRQSDALYRCSITLAAVWTSLVIPSSLRRRPRRRSSSTLRETAYRLLIRAEQARGDRSAALRAFARCEDILAAEFGAQPSPQTIALVESP